MKCAENKRVVRCVSKGRAVVVATPSWTMVRVTMNLFQHRYYKLGKTLMSLIGQWPYQSIRTKWSIFSLLVVITTYQIVAQLLAVVKYWEDWNILLECFVPNVFDAICASKYLSFTWNPQKTLILLNRMRTDWQVWARDQDVNILHAYAERGVKIIILYTVMMYSATFVFMIQPMITKLIDVVLKNDTEPGKLSFPAVYYYLDVQKYYFYLIMYSTLCALLLLTASVASDIMLIIYVQHVCSIFTAVGHRLERIGDKGKSTETGRTTYSLGKTDMVYLVTCIDRHNDAIECADLIKAIYAWNFFFTVGFGMILVNTSGLQILLRTSDVGATLTFIVITLNMIFYFYTESYISQTLIDHSISIRFSIQNSQWYRLPPKAQKLLQLMMMRCNVPCHLTVGNILTMSVQTFGMMTRTAASYFTCVRSMRGL